MNIYHSLKELPLLPSPVSLTIGTFDGVHLGHHILLSKLKSRSSHTVVLTFSNHPRQILQNKPTALLSDLFVKRALLQIHGIDTLLDIPFTRELADLTYDTFLSLLLQKMPLSHLVLGEGDAFGKNREGTPDRVSTFCQQKNISIDYLPKLIVDNQPVSSSRIRTCIQSGDLTAAERLLGRPYIFSIPAHRRRIDASALCLPPDGAYPFFSEDGAPLTIQIETDSEGHWIHLPQVFPTPTLIVSKIIEEFYRPLA